MTKLYLERVSETAKTPERSTTHAACFDIFADLHERKIKWYRQDNTESLTHNCEDCWAISPGERVLIPTGFKMRPESELFSIDFLPRSGGPLKTNVTLSNCIGIIDVDYPNETFVSLVNHGSEDIYIEHDQAIAQFRLAPVIPTEIIECDMLPSIESNRTGGFGSTD